jgi:hypothetical protein
MPSITRLPATALLVICAGTVAAADFDAADYHRAQCMRCHDTGVYTREDRRVRSFPMLEAQVARCDANLAMKLFPDDLALLVEYLNTHYYKFAK